MKTIFLYCLLLVAYQNSYAQNLLANGGFEDENICTEYKQNCAPEAWIATSLFANYYFDATQERAVSAHEGTHYVGLTAGNLSKKGERNFVRARLLCGLQAGHQYKFVMWLYARHNILDSIGIYFSEQDFLYERKFFRSIDPQLWSRDGLSTINEGLWKKVELLYTADGTEGFITIGNFKRNDYSGIRYSEYRNDYYFFLDDVSLMPVDPKEKLCFQADSIKNDIYAESERHNYLDRKVYQYRKTPPPVLALPKTTQRRIQHIDTLIIPDIFFATASYQLSPVSFQVLDSFASKLSLPEIDSMVVAGHTDSIGKLAYNETLSLNRAVSVKDYLNSKVEGLQAKTTTYGFAYLRPVASNKTSSGRQKNRRVEIILYREE
jgi:outer membrane protein OmpA-like peptidoglycan-associated protein